MARLVTILVLLAVTWSIRSFANMTSSYAVVVHRSNPTSSLRFTDLRSFFSGEITHWPNGKKLVLVERDLESTVFRFLMQHVLNTSAVEYQRHLANIEYREGTPLTVKVLKSDAAACKFVFNVPAAIALIEANSLALPECSGVQLATVDGKLPGEENYKLR